MIYIWGWQNFEILSLSLSLSLVMVTIDCLIAIFAWIFCILLKYKIFALSKMRYLMKCTTLNFTINLRFVIILGFFFRNIEWDISIYQQQSRKAQLHTGLKMTLWTKLWCLGSAVASHRWDPSSIPVLGSGCTWEGMVVGGSDTWVFSGYSCFLPILYTKWTVRRYQFHIRSSGWTQSIVLKFLSSEAVGVAFCSAVVRWQAWSFSSGREVLPPVWNRLYYLYEVNFSCFSHFTVFVYLYIL